MSTPGLQANMVFPSGQLSLKFYPGPEQSNEGFKAYCDGCGELLSAPCFTCIHCNYHLHKQYVEAPFEIPNHPLHPQHSDAGFFLRQRPHLDDDLLDRGSYSCGKPGCNYVVHVNCVLEDDDLYKVIEDEKQWEELYEKSMQSSIIYIIEVNEAGEATKIEHFSHQHCLVLADKMDEEIDRKCD
ncbi:hypothetical protein Golax_025848, partial [Gossypium laxum]|nr:hypothetical protein [Gossypium laxum]